MRIIEIFIYVFVIILGMWVCVIAMNDQLNKVRKYQIEVQSDTIKLYNDTLIGSYIIKKPLSKLDSTILYYK